MKYNPEIKHRRSIRLKEYDYSQAGAYFVTICTQNRECYLGSIVDGALKTTSAGNIAGSCLMIIPSHFKYMELDMFVVMPNHIHAIIVINNNNNRRGFACNARIKNGNRKAGVIYNAPTNNYFSVISPQRSSLPAIIRSYKSAVTAQCNKNNLMFQWQRNFYEHIIRSETELNEIREYIINNPLNWETDENYRFGNKGG